MKTARLLILLSLVACQGKAAAPSQAPAQPAPAQNEHPSPGAPAAAPGSAPNAGGLTWSEAAPLVRRTPKSSMRAAEYGVSGDDHAELAVFYFGPDQGGSVESNVSRWLGQITQPDGSDSVSKAKRSTREVGGITVTLVEVAGNYAGGMGMPGAPAPVPQADALLLGAIANGPNGPVFFKLVGAREAVERSRAAFDQMIGTLHASGG
jgi:hypothetical protein